MKKFISVLFAIFLFAASYTGCSSQTNDGATENNLNKNSENSKISIVTTIFPQYDFARQIAGDKAEITMLLPPGSESHSYEPTPQDIIKIQNCDLFIYVGGENDTWVESILDSMDKGDIKTIALLDCVDALGEELKEGMEGEEEEASNGEDGIEYDEHVWTSPQNAIAITNVIKDALGTIDPQNAQAYNTNASAYTEKLVHLDDQFREVVENADRNTIVFGDRFPLRYFTEAYGLDYWAAFPGCSGESEPSAATVAFLVDKAKAEKIPVVFKIELSNGNVADSIAEATGAKVLTFHSCHNLTKSDFESGATYLSLMEENVKVLQEALK